MPAATILPEGPMEAGKEDEGAALLGASEMSEFPRLRPYAALGLLSIVVVASAGLLLPNRGQAPALSEPSARLSEAAVQTTTPAKFWLMCPDAECIWLGKQGSDFVYKYYSRSPWDVSGSIDDTVSHLGAVPQGMWDKIRNKWMQSPPMFKGAPVTMQDLANFMRATLQRDPFSTGGQKVPWIDLREGGAGGPIHSQRKAIIVNHRQLAFLIINSLIGNKLQGVETGLDAAIARCNDINDAPGASPDMLYSLVAYLAILSRELVGDQDGTFLVGTTPGPVNNQWLQDLPARTMKLPTLCNHERLGAGTCGLSDFMAAGVPFQALTDIAGQDVGGGAQLCHVANSQDESLVIFYPEVLAFSIFVGNNRMLPVPFSLLGARRYLNTIYGETGMGPPFQNLCGKVDDGSLLNENILMQDVKTKVSITPVVIKASSFVAVASYCSDCHRGECSEPDMFNNLCDSQRRHLDQDISLWLQAYNNANYHEAVSQTFAAVVKRIGTGPWGGGLWQGDCQQYFLAVWLATSMLPAMELDYYIYDHFCENAGHQCFVLEKGLCEKCIQLSGMSAVIDASRCGDAGAAEMVQRMNGRQAQDIYYLLRDIGPPPTQVFELMEGMVLRKK